MIKYLMYLKERKDSAMKEKLAIIGASYLQLPLIEKAKEMGFETHVFAWKANDVGEYAADHFYPISIVEKEQILEECRKIGICGIVSIASDLAMVTVNYVAEELGLIGNSVETTSKSTNKYEMRKCFFENDVPSPKSILADEIKSIDGFRFPLIVKPIDRSGSRGISLVEDPSELNSAIDYAKEQSFSGKVLVEEFAEGNEYSIECISWNGEHRLLAITRKFTGDFPYFVEICHLQPAPVTDEMREKIRKTTFHALDSLGIRYGASHTELKISDTGEVAIIEIGGRMGGGMIGSTLVQLSTGVDFVRAVIETATGKQPVISSSGMKASALVHYICSNADMKILDRVKEEHPEYLYKEEIFQEVSDDTVHDSSERSGYFIIKARATEQLYPYI